MDWLTRQAREALASLKTPAAFFRYGLVLALVIAVADRLSKWAILYWVDLPARQKIVVTPFFDLTMVWNPGISYGLLPANSTLSIAVLEIGRAHV